MRTSQILDTGLLIDASAEKEVRSIEMVMTRPVAEVTMLL